MISKEIQLASRPEGVPQSNNFKLAEADIGDPQDGQILVRNLWMSVDPYMRARMNDVASYVPPFQIGEPLQGGAIGEVVASKSKKFNKGDYISHMFGWREYALCDEGMAQKIEPSNMPLEAFLGALGMPGMTAYAGLMSVAKLQDGETVFISAASGAVGAIACQIAKAKKCTVIGSAGSDKKCEWLKSVAGIDEVINYKTCGDLTKALSQAAPQGFDVYFENVGGDHLTAALNVIKPFGRIALCGMISQYNDVRAQAGPYNLILAIGKSLKMEGFIVTNHMNIMNDFQRDMAQWIGQGKIKWEQTIDEGIENAPQAFIKLFSGDNFGKMLVKLAD